jgi:hypothetical protein
MWPDQHPVATLFLLALVPFAVAVVALEWENLRRRWPL